jgi:hypothetical protein
MKGRDEWRGREGEGWEEEKWEGRKGKEGFV